MSAAIAEQETMDNSTRLNSLVSYFLKDTEDKNIELPFLQVSGITYLADWMLAVYDKNTFTGYKWKFTHYGPEQDELLTFIMNQPDFNTLRKGDGPGKMEVFISRSKTDEPDVSVFSDREKEILQHIKRFFLENKDNLNVLKEHIDNSYPALLLAPSEHYYDLKMFVDDFREILREEQSYQERPEQKIVLHNKQSVRERLHNR